MHANVLYVLKQVQRKQQQQQTSPEQPVVVAFLAANLFILPSTSKPSIIGATCNV